MAGPYSSLSDDDLLAKWQKFRDANEELALGGALAVIAGEGRRKEFTKANPGNLAVILRELQSEVNSRPTLAAYAVDSGSITLEFGRGFGGC